MLEDTRRAKRLFDEGGDEIKFAHLTNVQCSQIQDIVAVFASALRRARDEGCESLLVAMPELSYLDFAEALGQVHHEVFIATVYANAIDEGSMLPIHSSEI